MACCLCIISILDNESSVFAGFQCLQDSDHLMTEFLSQFMLEMFIHWFPLWSKSHKYNYVYLQVDLSPFVLYNVLYNFVVTFLADRKHVKVVLLESFLFMKPENVANVQPDCTGLHQGNIKQNKEHSSIYTQPCQTSLPGMATGADAFHPISASSHPEERSLTRLCIIIWMNAPCFILTWWKPVQSGQNVGN